jgi:tetratricopeptide (TPR) repeat protein
VVDSSVKAVLGLTPLSWCEDINGLRASAGLPDDPAKRAVVERARVELADANARLLSGKYAEALSLAKTAAETAASVRHQGTQAEALYLVGRTEQRLVAFTASEEAFRQALWNALESGNDVTALRASSALAWKVASMDARFGEADILVDLANSTLRRIGGNDELEGEILEEQATVVWVQGYLERGKDLYERSVQLFRRTVGVHPFTARGLINLGSAYADVGQREKSLVILQEAQDMNKALYGDDENYFNGTVLSFRGLTLAGMGRFPEAERSFLDSIEVFERGGPDSFWAASAATSLGLIHFLEGDYQKALEYTDRALDALSRLGNLSHDISSCRVTKADILVASGKAREAMPLCDLANVVVEARGLASDRVYPADALRCKGDVLLALGKPSDALAPLERSLTFPVRLLPWELPRVKFSLARALVATGGDLGRARALAEEARDALAPLPSLAAHVAAIDAWLAAQKRHAH